MTDAPPPDLVVEDNPEVGRILGPDGRLLRIVRAKPERLIGFHPPGRDLPPPRGQSAAKP